MQYNAFNYNTTYHFYTPDEKSLFGLFNRPCVTSRADNRFFDCRLSFEKSEPEELTEIVTTRNHAKQTTYQYYNSLRNPWLTHSQQTLAVNCFLGDKPVCYNALLIEQTQNLDTFSVDAWHKSVICSYHHTDIKVETTFFPSTERSFISISAYDNGPHFFKNLPLRASLEDITELESKFKYDNTDRLSVFIEDAFNKGLLQRMHETPRQLAAKANRYS